MDAMEHDTEALQELSAMLLGDAVPSSLDDREDLGGGGDTKPRLETHAPVPLPLYHSEIAWNNNESDSVMTESSYTTATESGGSIDALGTKKHYRQGRQKKAAELIDNHNRLHVAFCKRKDGAMKKAAELDVMTGCAILLVIQPAPNSNNNSTPVSTYAYSSSAWKSVFFGEGMRAMLNEPHTKRTSRLYQPTEKYPEGVLGSEYHEVYTRIADKLSDSRDESCTYVHESMRRCKTEEPTKNLQQRQTTVDVDSLIQQYEASEISVNEGDDDDDDDDDEEMGYFDAQISGATSDAPEEQHKPRKRSYTPETLIPNLATRSLCYSKRRLGLFKKIFELVALTDCRAVIASAWMPSTGETPLKYHVYASPEWRNSAGYTRMVHTLVSSQALEHVHAANPACPHEAQAALVNFMDLLGHGGSEFETAMARAYAMDDYLLPSNAINVETPSMAQQKRMRKATVVAAATKKGAKIKQTTWIKFLWVFPPKQQGGCGIADEHPRCKKEQQRRVIASQSRKQRASEKFMKELSVFIPETSDSDAIPDTGVQHGEYSTNAAAAAAAVAAESRPVSVAMAPASALKRRRSIERSESEDTNLLQASLKEPRVQQPCLSESELKAACDAIDLLIRMNESGASMTRASLVVSTPPPMPTPAVTKAPPVPRLASPKVVARGTALSVSVDSVSISTPAGGVVRRVEPTKRSSIVMLM
jgi:hypothetical protein